MEQSKSVFSMEKIFILRKWKKIYPVFFFSGEKNRKKRKKEATEVKVSGPNTSKQREEKYTKVLIWRKTFPGY